MSEENSGSAESAPIENAEIADQSQEVAQEGQDASPEQEAIENIEAAVENGDISKKEAEKLIKKYTIKVRGKEIEREVDLSDDNYIKNQLQLAEASKMSMQETAEMKKLLANVEQQLKNDPWAVMKQLGLDPDELAEMRIESRIAEMKKSPEQIALEKRDQELEELRREAKLLKEEKEAAEFAKMQDEAAVQIETEITRALDSHKTLPKSKHVVKRIADSMLWAMNQGYDDVTADDVIPLVERDLRDELNRFMEEMPEDMLESYIGKKTTEKLRAKRLQAIQPKTLSQVKPTAKSVESKETEERRKISSREFFKRLGK